MTAAVATTADPAPDRPARPRRTSRRGYRHAAMFILPFLVPFLLFYIAPVGYAIYQSFFKIARAGGIYGVPHSEFAGFSQFVSVFHDSAFGGSLLRTLLFGVVQVPVMLLVALVLALLLDSNLVRGTRFFRITYFLPYAVPGVLAAIMWGFLYQPSVSPLLDLIGRLGFHPDLLGANTVLWSIANVVTWTYVGYNMLIIYSALQAIPQELYEAARMDGAGDLRVALSVKIPSVRPALILTLIFSIIGTLQLFNEPQVFRSISNQVTSTYTPNLTVYSAAVDNNYNYAAALSVILALGTFVLSMSVLKISQRGANS